MAHKKLIKESKNQPELIFGSISNRKISSFSKSIGDRINTTPFSPLNLNIVLFLMPNVCLTHFSRSFDDVTFARYLHLFTPQVEQTGQETAGSRYFRSFCGSSIPAGNFLDFSDDFRPVPTGKQWKLTRIHRTSPFGILLPCSSDFQCFPAESGDFPASFLQDPVTEIIDLGRFPSCTFKIRKLFVGTG